MATGDFSFNQLDIRLEATHQKDKIRMTYAPAGQSPVADSRYLDTTTIQHLLRDIDQHYYRRSGQMVDTQKLGRILYDWLDSEDRILTNAIREFSTEKLLVLAFWADEALLHLPWELLHDGVSFLVAQTRPGILPVRLLGGKESHRPPAQRNLELLFMASSPRNGALDRLKFEEEEARIFQATRKLALELEVEESGNLEELSLLYSQLGEEQVDIVHLSGHADDRPEPYFITEDPFGYLLKSSAQDIADSFPVRKPSLLFLSGCRTGGARESGTIPSLAADLVHRGFPAVLAWALPVYDHTATEVAIQFYHALSRGSSVPQAIALSMQHLLKERERFPDWHLLRLYVPGTVPDRLILPGRYPKRKRVTEQEFLDPIDKKVRVPNRLNFIGRRHKTQDALRVLRDSDKIGVIIQGTGGLGKSSLAARIASRLERFSRPIVWVGKLNESNLLHRLRETLGPEVAEIINSSPGQLAHILQAVFERYTGKRLLLILDDFEQNVETNEAGAPLPDVNGQFRLQPEAAQVFHALCTAIQLYRRDNQAPQLILTCRYKFQNRDTLDLECLHLTSFTESEWDRFTEHKQIKSIGNAVLQDRILKVADGNPRLLEWLLDVVKTQSEAENLLDLLEAKEMKFREDLLAKYLFEQLPSTARRVLQWLSIFEIPVPLAALSPLSELDDIAPILQKTIGWSLVDYHDQFYGELIDHYRLAAVLKKLLPPADKDQCAQAVEQLYEIWGEEYYESQALEMCRLALLGEQIEVLQTVGVFYISRIVNTNRYKEAVALGELMLALIPENFSLLLNLGRTNKVLGKIDQAITYFTKAENFGTDDGDKALLFNELAHIYLQRGEVDRALSLYEQSLSINEKTGNEQGKGATFHELANIYLQRGEVDRALSLYEQSLSIKEKIGDEKGKGATLHALAYIYRQRGEVDRALSLYAQSLSIYEKIGDEQGKGAMLGALAHIYLQRGEVDRALSLYEQSLSIYEKIGDEQGKGATLHALAYIYRQRGEVDRALSLYAQSLSIKEKIGDEQGKSATFYELANIYRQRGEVDRALSLYEQSLSIDKKIGDEQGKGATLHELANIYLQRGEIDRALSLYAQSLSIDEKIGDERGKGVTLHAMANIYLQRGEVDRALSLYEQSLSIYEKIGDEKGKGATLHAMANIYLQRGEVDRALSLYAQSLSIKEKIGDLAGQATTSIMLAQLLVQLEKKLEHAWALAQKAVAIYQHLQHGELEQMMELAIGVLFDKIRLELGEERLAIFKEKIEKEGREQAMTWAEEQKQLVAKEDEDRLPPETT